MELNLPIGKKVYFASDFHFGIPTKSSSDTREKLVCKWLDEISNDAAIIYLVGDIFDAWMEYKTVVPKGSIRFLGKLALLKDKGITVEVFTGNHDLWMYGYFEEALGIPVHHNEIQRTINGKSFIIGHGDGLGPGDNGYKILKKILRNPICQWMYRWIHPDIGFGIASYFSKQGPKHIEGVEDEFKCPQKEFLVQYCQNVLKSQSIDYFVFGHRHLAIEYPLNNTSLYINLGDWIKYNSYAVFDGFNLQLKYYKNEH
jgi:UDP-2,3-diacylglucosamine hydrolase